MTTDLVIDLEPPARMSRVHLLVRLLLAVTLGTVANAVGWSGAFVYFALPALAALLISQRGVEVYARDDARPITRVLGWLMGFHAYMGLLTDRFPLAAADEPVRYQGSPHTSASVGTAVLRVVTSIPLAFVLALLGIVAWVLWVLAVVAILFAERYPRSWFDVQCGILRFQGRMLAYHASLVDEYPRLWIDVGPNPRATAA